METQIDTPQIATRWYVIQARSNCEKSVAQSLRDRIERSGLNGQFGEVLVPSEEIVEMRAGQKRQTERKFFPGYVLIQVADSEDGGIGMSSEAWHLVKETDKVLGFIGGTALKPMPITEKEAQTILNRVKSSVEKPRHKVLFEQGQMVRVIDGPFNDFNGVVDEVNYDKARIRVSVLIFGRATPIDLGFTQVEAA
jgi:transcriptional antiterminator NusG